jgi:ABC-type nitrate/sulfonate/bicarbonate transport system substrate-binding protein
MRRAAVLRRAIALLAFLACAAASAPAAAPAAFTLALDGPVSAAHAPYLHAIASGAFATAGLAVSVAYPEDRGAALKALAAGAADACAADAAAILAARAGGAAITIVASVGDLHPACMVSRAEAGIASPAGLEGRRVAMDPLNGDRLLFPLFLAGAGLRAEDITPVPLDGAGGQAALAAGTVDAALGRMERVETGLAVLPWAGHGFVLYGPCLAVRDDALRGRAPVVRAFLKAVLRAYEACLQDPAAGARSAAASGLVALEAAESWLAAARYRFDTETYRKKGLGWIDGARMAATLEAVRGMIGQPVAFAAADAFSTAYLPVPAILRRVDERAAPAGETTPLKR